MRGMGKESDAEEANAEKQLTKVRGSSVCLLSTFSSFCPLSYIRLPFFSISFSPCDQRVSFILLG